MNTLADPCGPKHIFPAGDATKSTTAEYLKKMKGNNYYKCQVCDGYGHYFYECPTKKKLDKAARDNNDKYNWGAWKSVTYFKDLTPMQKELSKTLGKRRRTSDDYKYKPDKKFKKSD